MKKIAHLLSCSVLIFTITPSFSSPAFALNRKQVQQTRSPKLVWISLDGLQLSEVRKYLALTPKPHSHGFQSLLKNANGKEKLRVTNPTITASSHISTMTCTPPGVHGVYSNKQWDGTAMVSGFKYPYRGESFAAALKQQGLKVVSVGYPGLDDGKLEHTASVGIGYDDVAGKPLFKEITVSQADFFEVPSRVVKGKKLRVDVSYENNQLSFLMPTGEKILGKVKNWINLNFISEGRNEQIPVYIYSASKNTLQYYVGPVGLNNAYPIEFRQKLDSENIVFSNARDYSMADVSDELYVAGLAHRQSYFASVANIALETENPDAMFVYFEDLDVLGHQYSGYPEKDALRAAHFARLDKILGDFLSRLPSSTNVVVVGDHGMSTVKYDINANKILPAELSKNYLPLASGGAFFLYGKGVPLSEPAPISEPWFLQTLTVLENARVEFDGNRKVFSKVVIKGSQEAKALGLDGDSMPWIVALAEPGLGVMTSFDSRYLVSKRADFQIPADLQLKYPTPMNNGKPVLPLAGSHGHINTASEMHTSLFLSGAQLGHLNVNDIEMNIHLVPAVADALGWQRPAGCQNQNR